MFEEIMDGIYVLYSGEISSNAYVLIGKKIVLIDSGLSIVKDSLLKNLDGIGLKPENIDLVLHTHGHADHFGGDEILINSNLLMHEFDAKRVVTKDILFTCSDSLSNNYYPKISSYIKGDDSFDISPFKIETIETPGHTMGSLCFFERKRKILFSGDTLFNGRFGRTDLPSGSRKNMLNSLEKLKETNFDILCPGHGQILKQDQKLNIEKAMENLKSAQEWC